VAQPGGELPHAAGRPPVDYVWRARETMNIEYGGRGRRVTVYRHNFPGSTLWMDFWDRVEGARWEEDTLNIFEWYLSRDKASVLVDFGSWIGPSVLWGGLFASRVYSIEPDPVSFSTLVANINANPETAAKTSVFWRCIAPKDGEVDMAGSGESNTRMVGVLDSRFLKAGSRWTVPCLTLPNFIAEQRIDVSHLQLIKMDTEGTELWLLPSLRPWLESLKDKKPAFWLSVHSPFWLDKKPAELQAAWDVLALFKFVYDQNLKRIYPAKTKPNFEEDFCTFLLSDIEYGGKNTHK
jgi:FkbM family methyltransferase